MAELKKVNVVLIEEETEPKWYREMKALVKANHPHLKKAKIALFWQHGWAEDADGKLVLGRASKANDLNRALHDHDFAIELNFEVFNSADWTIEQARALIDHELTHCEVKRQRWRDRYRRSGPNRLPDSQARLRRVQRRGGAARAVETRPGEVRRVDPRG